jgi:MerR family transcriptional regulator/heat shock protein HspR
MKFYTITEVSQMLNIHPQTLRQYDRLGLVSPSRTKGFMRKYSMNNVKKLKTVQYLANREGININGIRRILNLEEELYMAKIQLKLKERGTFFEVQKTGETNIKSRLAKLFKRKKNKKIILTLEDFPSPFEIEENKRKQLEY